MFWFIFIAITLFTIIFMWKAYIHPSHTLGRQAASMKWVAVGRVADEHGYKNVKLKREHYEAIISYKDENVQLIVPYVETPFNDFIEIDEWINKTGS